MANSQYFGHIFFQDGSIWTGMGLFRSLFFYSILWELNEVSKLRLSQETTICLHIPHFVKGMILPSSAFGIFANTNFHGHVQTDLISLSFVTIFCRYLCQLERSSIVMRPSVDYPIKMLGPDIVDGQGVPLFQRVKKSSDKLINSIIDQRR